MFVLKEPTSPDNHFTMQPIQFGRFEIYCNIKKKLLAIVNSNSNTYVHT